ncbi:DNA recombination protein RmuC [Parapusillimonas granuli]|uniref:DNA recombination protein RmuC n=1 Tax=Parapusillimonas granuli TaxID=380911 RepID=A0A853FXC1_9BURK|nr:DNA recombination protein RmuC [Parapusillimonas granuli]MBB5214815.1 DNA recombination protein RmuC [Parapusillimonas granuli]MEB2397937.1 DNA recombination protein RmuC [Alcaligenaceae bacterium]NYT48777.1 DNA recombination protein RmuC [Parapusillimonas granuli]
MNPWSIELQLVVSGALGLAAGIVIALLASGPARRASRRAARELERRLIHSEAEAAGLRERLDDLRAESRLKDEDMRRTRDVLKAEFENLANQILEEKGRHFTLDSRRSMDALLAPLREQIEAFQRRVNQVHDEAVRGNAILATEVRRVLDVGLKMSAEAENLAGALKGDKKTAGNWGEMQLEQALQLAGLMRGDHYDAQLRLRDQQGNARLPDFVVKLPDQKHILLDSKVSLVDYERAVAARTPEQLREALDAHAKAVRHHIDDLSRKDYSNLPGMRSPSFVLMFMPIEAAYIEAMKHDRELFDYGYRRNVVLVSHTTLMPILKTVANLWMTARSNEQAHELSARAGEIYNQVAMVAERLKRLGATLDTAGRHYNEVVKSLAGQQGLYGKAARFRELSSRANRTMPDLTPLHADHEHERLDLIVSGGEANGTGTE